MVAIMIGSSVFSLLLSKGFRAEETLRIILVILALSMGICCVMASPNRNTNDMVIIYAAFLILEVAIGMYFPAMSYLKSQIIPEGHRANVRVHHMFLRILNHLKGGYPIIFASNVFHNFHLIQKCIQNQQQLLKLYTFLNQMRVEKNIRRKDDRITSL